MVLNQKCFSSLQVVTAEIRSTSISEANLQKSQLLLQFISKKEVVAQSIASITTV